jgi:hypothetical protein
MGPFGTTKESEHGWRIAQAGAKARAEVGQFLHGYYGPDFDVDKHAIFGPAAEVWARLWE